MNSFLNAFSDFLAARAHHIHRIAEYRTGSGIDLVSLSPATPCQNTYSVAKVFTVAAIGLLSDRGLIDTDAPVPEALGGLCPATFDPLWKETSVHMLLKHHIGLPEGFLDIDSCDANGFPEDHLSFVMNHPLDPGHGRRRCYTDAAYYILSCIVENRSGLPLDNFLWRELFRPMAFRDAAWSHCPRGHAIGATGLFIRTEDMVKLGALYLEGGVWQGRRLLSEKWTETVIARGYEFSPIGRDGAYGKGGMLGQMLMVVPEERRAAAWQAASGLGQEGAAEFVCSFRG